jgi:hypothetical protein
MSETSEAHARRSRLTTRIDSETLAEIERLAQQRRTTTAQVARVILEDGVRAISETAA